MAEKKLTFEQAMARLEEIVARLDTGEQTLDRSLALYEEGSKLMKQCASALDKAEQKVKKLRLTAEGEVTEAPFEAVEE